MNIKLCCCLMAFALISDVAADVDHVVVNETRLILLRCHQSVKGDVTWSREKDGRTSRIITISGDEDEKHTNDPRYLSLADKSLVITNVKSSDSGRYDCNNEPAVELTVIPSGTEIKTVRERKNVTLKCPDEDDSKWSRLFGEIPQRRIQMKDQKLIIKDARREDTGLYFCGGKPAAFLNVTRRRSTPEES
ncbi:hypothetical protein FQA47_010506 [Oryzias melastigma]|uniref:Ig-like domain-containing protein n=1 Tax=Oryzias melastigma TaxID=30732 RepID=A0A834F2U1_ORYME|nr:hypothetical protein FQA47_010506 [Oryzias melastigma]